MVGRSVLLVGSALLLASWAVADPGGGSPFASVEGTVLTAAECEETEGDAHVMGDRVSNYQHETQYVVRTTNPDKPHCDVIARNKANELRRETMVPGGDMDFNKHTVEEISKRYESGGMKYPKRGSIGYIFTFGRKGAGHLQVYQRGRNQRDYYRHSNGSYAGTSRRYRARLDYRPANVVRQFFVPLKPRHHNWTWHR